MRQVLIIEDDRIQSLLLTKQVKRLGYGVSGRIASGEEAIKKVLKLKPDFILMDINLEGKLDGIETMKIIKKFCDAPFIYLTGNTDPLTESRAKETGPLDYLMKPVELKALNKVLSIL